MLSTENPNKPMSNPEAYSPIPLFIRLFVSVFEDIEDSEPVEEKRWKNYDGYHFVSRVIKSENLDKHIDPTSDLKKTMKYAL